MIIAFGSTGRNALSSMEKEKEFAMAYINSQATKDIKYGLINYADTAGVYSKLGEFTKVEEVKDAIRKLSWAGEGIGLDKALTKAAQQFKKYGRPEAYKVFLVFITGPASANKNEVKLAAQDLSHFNVRIVSVLMGDESENIVSHPNDVVKAKPTDKPNSVAKDISDTIGRGNTC